MDYMRQLNGFWNWRKTNILTHVQADLYFSLLACANAVFWRSSLSIPNSTLMGMCQICKTELHKARIALVQKGLIEYSKGKKGTAGKYVIVPLYETNVRTNQRNIYKHNTKIKTNTSQRKASYDLAEIERLLNSSDF